MPLSYEQKHKYGISQETYDAMLKAQLGRCDICGRKMSPPCIDHDYESGVVRGLLCSNCNTGLGLLGDSVRRLAQAIVYLEEHGKTFD